MCLAIIIWLYHAGTALPVIYVQVRGNTARMLLLLWLQFSLHASLCAASLHSSAWINCAHVLAFTEAGEDTALWKKPVASTSRLCKGQSEMSFKNNSYHGSQEGFLRAFVLLVSVSACTFGKNNNIKQKLFHNSIRTTTVWPFEAEENTTFPRSQKKTTG